MDDGLQRELQKLQIGSPGSSVRGGARETHLCPTHPNRAEFRLSYERPGSSKLPMRNNTTGVYPLRLRLSTHRRLLTGRPVLG